MTLILGIETSCDETAAAVVEDGRLVLSSVVSSQVDLHARFGGVVPEIASRAHVELITPVIAEALVEAGVELDRPRRGRRVPRSRARRRAARRGERGEGARARGRPALRGRQPPRSAPVRRVARGARRSSRRSRCSSCRAATRMIVVMEEHGRYRVVGQTVDDAAGEAFDKVARFLGLGYPGGPVIDRLARDGDADRGALPAGDAGRGRLLVRGAEDRGREPRAASTPTRRSPTSRRRSRRRSSTSSSTSCSPRPTRRGAPVARHRRRRRRELPPPGAGGRGRRGHRAAASSSRRPSSAPTTGR